MVSVKIADILHPNVSIPEVCGLELFPTVLKLVNIVATLFSSERYNNQYNLPVAL